MLLLLFLLTIKAGHTPQCPVPEDRSNAWYSGKSCDWVGSGCCFNEVINGNITPCCYAYGTDGAIKCCGYVGKFNFDFDYSFYEIMFICALFGLYAIRKAFV